MAASKDSDRAAWDADKDEFLVVSLQGQSSRMKPPEFTCYGKMQNRAPDAAPCSDVIS